MERLLQVGLVVQLVVHHFEEEHRLLVEHRLRQDQGYHLVVRRLLPRLVEHQKNLVKHRLLRLVQRSHLLEQSFLPRMPF